MRLEMTEKLFRIYYEIRRKAHHRLLKNKDISIITNIEKDFIIMTNSHFLNG